MSSINYPTSCHIYKGKEASAFSLLIQLQKRESEFLPVYRFSVVFNSQIQIQKVQLTLICRQFFVFVSAKIDHPKFIIHLFPIKKIQIQVPQKKIREVHMIYRIFYDSVNFFIVFNWILVAFDAGILANQF